VTSDFGTLPFEAQLAHIHTVAREGDPRALLAEAGALPDAEPLARLLEALAAHGRLPSLEGELAPLLDTLPEAALQHLLTRESTVDVAALLERQVECALMRWPIARLSSIAFAARWLRRRAPEAHARLVARAEQELAEPDDEAARWLLFTRGTELAARTSDARWAGLVQRTAREAIDALARAPKSISQANAERLLAQRVYADPGHFLFELLQNADDAGASRWSVVVGSDRVLVRHDGAPFSFLDLIGVLSIGQTTKRENQIGFFGVGFKSVYEICERPRIRSGAFAFEIAHVSIPRALGPSDDEAPRHVGETVLVLPYARALDVPALHGRARAIPPETLMTLPHLGALGIEGPDGARVEWREERVEAAAGERITLSELGGEVRAYRSATRHVTFEGPREEGKAREGVVKVAVALDARGAPTPVRGPTLYAFLPTAERTGLRAMVHARFDVTLDRERLELGSAWNDALLAEAGRTLAALLSALTREGHDVLPVIAAPEERAPSMAPLAETLIAELRATPLLPAARGDRIAAIHARILEPSLARALAHEDLGDGTYALAPLEPRERSIAAELGARSFGAIELVAWMERALAPNAPPPQWLGDAVLRALVDAPIDDARLAALPMWVDGSGALVSAYEGRIAPATWAALYAGERPIVARETIERAPPALVQRLPFRALEPTTLIDDLRDPARRAVLVTRERELVAVLMELDPSMRRALDDVPLWPVEGGGLASMGAIHVLDPALEPLRDTLAVHAPIALARFVEAHPEVASWLTRFGVSELATLLEADADALGEPALARLEPILDALAPTLPRALLQRLARLPLVVDRHGVRRALLGPGSALRAHALPPLPSWPWLARPDAPFVLAVDPPLVDARAVALALLGEGPFIAASELRDVWRWLAPQADELPAGIVDRLAHAPIWLDVHGAARPLGALRRGTPSSALDALYAALGTRTVVSDDALRFARALGLDRRLPISDHAALVGDLVRGPVPDVPRALLTAALEEAAARLRPDELAPLASLPLFADREGTLRPLGSWSAPDASRVHRPGPYRAVLEQGPWPLLAIDDEASLARLVSIIGPPVATPSDVIAHASALLADPSKLLAFVDAHLDVLDEAARLAIAELPLFESGAGVRHPSRALALRAPLLEVLGPVRVRELGIEDVLFAPPVEARVLRLALPSRSIASLLTERILPALRAGQPLDAQPGPWRSGDDLVALAKLALQHEVAIASAAIDYPLALDARGRVVHGPCFVASDAARALVAALPLAERLADREWSEALSGELGDVPSLMVPLAPRRIAEALREACPDEAPRADHPVVRDDDALFAWLREIADELARDEVLRGTLGGAAIVPSQRETRRAPRDLVLDADLPDLGLGWGLAPDVPFDVARLLRQAFELDRRARRALVAHVLDGLDDAARADDVDRGADLVAFLARALGASEASVEELDERVRRLDVRARLKVPVAHAQGRSWDKPRFAWAPSDGVAAEAERFALDLPPRIALPADRPSQRLLAACGARDDLDDRAVIACLDGALRDGLDARRALARYVAARALASPARMDRWKLATRAWVPGRDGAVHRASELVWPDPLAHALFGEDAPLLPDHAVVAELPEEAAARLGFRRAATMSLSDVASRIDEARPALLAWLEEGLAQKRFAPADVRAALRDRLSLRDDEGTLRPVRELARSGARELFGPRRGDFAAGRDHPRLTRALGIPSTPDGPMIAAFLLEIGAEAIDARERDRLAHHLPECLARLAESDTELPTGAAIAGLHGDRVVISRVGDPALRMLIPPTIADALDASVLDAWIDPLPTERDARLIDRLTAAGVPDLWAIFDVRAVLPGPRREELEPEADAWRASVAPMLPAIGTRVRVVDALAVRGVIGVSSGAGYRSAGREELTVPVEAAIDAGTLWLTPIALREPARIAPALEREPARRRALAAWLTEARRDVKPPKPSGKSEPASEDESGSGFFERMKRWLGGDAPREPAPSVPVQRATPKRSHETRARDEGFFRPRAEIEAQLDRSDGWLDARREAPAYGFAFTPSSLGAPWVYAPSLVATRFDARAQRWDPVRLPMPVSRGDAGVLSLRGKLPAGDNVLPVPTFGRIVDVRIDGEPVTIAPDARALRVDRAAEVRIRVVLGVPPDLDDARCASIPVALQSVVPDAELPDEVHDFLASLDDESAAIERALAVRDFVRDRYRYDPSYLEDPSVGKWLARITQGRVNAHVAALHAGADGRYLGAGVCYELNVLACELLRRAGIPSAIATGWVLTGGQLSEPDHLWALALLTDARGEAVWVPIDASTTRDGRPLRVPRRPPGRFRPPPADPRTRAPEAPRWERLRVERGTGHGPSGARPPKKKRIPRAELLKVIHHLEKLVGEPLDAERREELQDALTDRARAEELLRRLRD
jgi:hypothetical protein